MPFIDQVQEALMAVSSFDQIQEALKAMGPAGLAFLAFLDSAGIPTGGAPDIAILLMAPDAVGPIGLLWLVLAAVLGSVLGCMVLYRIGRVGGERVLTRFAAEQRQQVKEKLDLYGFWAMFFSVMGPPPYPTKVFVLSGGVFGMRLDLVFFAVLLGRALRYGLAAYLGYHYGGRAEELLSENYVTIFVGVLVAIALVALWQYWRRRPSKAIQEDKPEERML